MILAQRPRLVLLGMMSKIPVAGVVWQTVHYLVGFRRLGYDVHYVEAHARTPGMLMEGDEDDASARAAEFIDGVMRRFDLGDRWAFHALHDDGRCYGMSESELKRLYREAALLVNLHGGTEPLPEHSASGRLVYVETDPVAPQVELHNGFKRTVDFLEPHVAFFTYGENYGNADCGLPMSERFRFRPTRQPVVMDFWEPNGNGSSGRFTTIGNWRQRWRNIFFRGETYRWSKHHEFMKFIDLPTRTDQPLELALSNCDRTTRQMLQEKGWWVRDALHLSADIDRYRTYISGSRAEFTVAKDQNVRLRSGWFSDRSATYLAAGRPVITQETGFSNVLPTGLGLHAFTTADEILQGIDAINADYQKSSRAAEEVASEYFSHEVVLTRLLADVGCSSPPARSAVPPAATDERGERGIGAARLLRLVERRVPKVIDEISPLDREFRESPKQYFQWGQRAVRCLKIAMLAGRKGGAESILVLPSGHGRTLRAIRASFPHARLTAWDLDRDAVDFCVRVFGAIPAYGDPDPSANTLGEAFDLIWCDSLLSSVDVLHWQGFLRLLSAQLSPRGLLVLTTRGPRVVRLMRNAERQFGLTSREIQTLLATYDRDGFAHLQGGAGRAKGVSLASPEWVCSQLAALADVGLVGFTEGGYGDEDVIACIRESPSVKAMTTSPAKWSQRAMRRVP